MTTSFTPLASFLGGALIGLSAFGLMWGLGRVAGISGIAAGAMTAKGERAWRAWFVGGLVAGGVVTALAFPQAASFEIPSRPLLLVLAGLLVGYGTRLGNGCTSGHGVCGLSRFSSRSFVATLCFMAAGFLTVFLTRHLLGVGQ